MDKAQKEQKNVVWSMDVCVMCCQVEVSATGRSLVQRSPTDWDVSFGVI
jgi:NADH:ubiquinone oxidoreductase subunit B-like Fe-S oxidoreductase